MHYRFVEGVGVIVHPVLTAQPPHHAFLPVFFVVDMYLIEYTP